MNKIIALALVGTVLGLAVAPTAFAIDTSTSALCGADGPESYKRPGGYCEQIGATDSIVETGDGLYEEPIVYAD